MARFRKKPVEIDAVRWTGREIEGGAPDWIKAANELDPLVPGGIIRIDDTVHVFTLEGRMIAQPGDWIIRGVKGELYPCKPDIFAATYDPVA
ncbi:hypothetical protein [Methylobacterium platani]|uniref:Uncharacterized protein n=2 Tax=Methylobacterium platani TaxID=427683 RepID=A0A179SEQ9_9HYPH|nr:hypothetical protein [Methylobacterium platani]KMO21403.1 hypothetical protein SQ03_03370 [Methylobacterium platani JCM 14648]OAS26318.1 hypothetical protein A5481_06280 [Methylobacterium platani]